MGRSKIFNLSIEDAYWLLSVHDDENAFRVLFYQFFAPLCVFANRYIEDRGVCEDIVQDTFLKLWKNRKSQSIKVSIKNFLITNVKNGCIDYLRRREFQQKCVTQLREKYMFEKQDYEEIYTISELEQIINSAVNKLPPKVKEVFEMNRFEDMSYKEIAEHNHISIKTVEAYMTKALKILRIELKDYLCFLYLFL